MEGKIRSMNYYHKRVQAKIEGQIKRISPFLYNKIKTYQLKTCTKELKIFNVIDVSLIDTVELNSSEYSWITNNYLNHFFDILGSGWISFNKDDSSGRSYKEIAWNRDFRSGYVWKNEENHVYDYVIPNGGDIKNVWELGRLQHLLRLSLLYIKNRDYSILNEYCCQVCDFMNNNPVGIGVHWTCAMEVSIRAINLLMSYDIINNISSEIIDEKFKKEIANYIYGHGIFILNNLEFVRKCHINHNHYYTDILGILYISIYLKRESWYEFAKLEFLKESKNQFLQDGTNMEGSTCYHKLCTEILQLGIAAILHHDNNCENELLEILSKATEYLKSLSLPNNEIPQIGDNDSGRIISLTPNGYQIKESYSQFSGFEQINNLCRDSTRNVNSIFSRGEALTGIPCDKKYHSPLEMTFIKAIVGEIRSFDFLRIPKEYIKDGVHSKLPKKNKITTIIRGQSLLSNNKGWEYYPCVGICIYKSLNAYVLINLGKQDINHFMGHIHDDVLGIEVWVNGKPIIEDPGSLTYTAKKDVRDLFRSYKMHYIPQYSGQMDIIEKDVFSFSRHCKAEIQYCNRNELCLRKEYCSATHFRKIIIKDDLIEISDESESRFSLPSVGERYIYSDCYGSVIYKNRPIDKIEIVNECYIENEKI